MTFCPHCGEDPCGQYARCTHGKEMVDGYIDGLNADSPEPSANRTHCYRHGFANGRDDLRRRPRAFAQTLREMAVEAERLDMEQIAKSANCSPTDMEQGRD